MRRQKKQVFGFSISKKYLLSFLSLSKKKKLVEMISRIYSYNFNGLMSLEGLRHMGDIETLGKSKWLMPGLPFERVEIKYQYPFSTVKNSLIIHFAFTKSIEKKVVRILKQSLFHEIFGEK